MLKDQLMWAKLYMNALENSLSAKDVVILR